MSCYCDLDFVHEETVDQRDEIIYLVGGRSRTLKWLHKLDFIDSSISTLFLILLMEKLSVFQWDQAPPCRVESFGQE